MSRNMLIIIAITNLITMIFSIKLHKRFPIMSIICCYLIAFAGFIAGLFQLFLAVVGIFDFDFLTAAQIAKSASITIFPCLATIFTGITLSIITLKNTYRKTLYGDLDILDEHLLQEGLMPIQHKNKKRYRKKKMKERKNRKLAKEQLKTYVYIQKTDNEIITKVHNIYKKYKKAQNTEEQQSRAEDELIREIVRLARDTARQSNKSFNWDNPTTFVTKAVYADVRTLYDIMYDIIESEEQLNINEQQQERSESKQSC